MSSWTFSNSCRLLYLLLLLLFLLLLHVVIIIHLLLWIINCIWRTKAAATITTTTTLNLHSNTRIIRTKGFNNWCRLIFLLLLLLWLLLLCNNVLVHLKMWYYRRSTWHSEECSWAGSGKLDVPPRRGIMVAKNSTIAGQHYILKNTFEQAVDSHTYPHSTDTWWPRMVIWKVNFTFWRMQLGRQWDSQTYPHTVEASGGQEQYYIRSVLHLFAHFIFSCWRGKSYIGIWIGDMSSRTLSNCYRMVSFVVVVVVVTVSCCCLSLIVDHQL